MFLDLLTERVFRTVAREMENRIMGALARDYAAVEAKLDKIIDEVSTSQGQLDPEDKAFMARVQERLERLDGFNPDKPTEEPAEPTEPTA